MTRAPALISSLPVHLPIAVRRHGRCDLAEHPGGGGAVIHDHSTLGLHLSGERRLWMRLDYVLTRGDLVLIPEGMPHCGSEGGGGEGELLGVMLCTACMRGAWGAALREAFEGVRRGGVAVRRFGAEELVEVERLIGVLGVELAAQRPQRELMVDGLMSQLVAQIARAAPAQVSAAAEAGCPPVVAEALAYIERNAARAISLIDVARAVGRSPTHLAALMKHHTGRTVVAWITHGRMALARQLLLSSEAGIEVIAEHVGFASPSHFHRTFRRLHDATPGEWRQAHRGGVEARVEP